MFRRVYDVTILFTDTADDGPHTAEIKICLNSSEFSRRRQ